MSVYTASEKTALLRKIAEAGKGIFVIKDKREVSIAKMYLIQDKCIKSYGNLLGDCLQCEITEVGKLYIEQGIYEKEEEQNKEKEKTKALERENIRLRNNKLKYEKRTRWMSVISLAVSIFALLISAISLLQNASETPVTPPYDSASTSAETEISSPCDSTEYSLSRQSKVHSQCSQNRCDRDSQTDVSKKVR